MNDYRDMSSSTMSLEKRSYYKGEQYNSFEYNYQQNFPSKLLKEMEKSKHLYQLLMVSLTILFVKSVYTL